MTKLTKRFVEAVEPQSKGHVVWDDELPGFGLRVYASGKRSYIVQYRSRGRSRRYTIGLHGVWTPDTARRQAKALLGQVAHGGDYQSSNIWRRSDRGEPAPMSFPAKASTTQSETSRRAGRSCSRIRRSGT